MGLVGKVVAYAFKEPAQTQKRFFNFGLKDVIIQGLEGHFSIVSKL